MTQYSSCSSSSSSSSGNDFKDRGDRRVLEQKLMVRDSFKIDEIAPTHIKKYYF